MTFDLLLLGSGLSGLSAAVALVDRGVRPVVLESRPFVGGRLRSFVHEGIGEEIDNGRHLITGAYSATLELLRKLGTDRFLIRQDRLSVEFRESGGVTHHLDAPRYLPPPLDVLVGLLRTGGLSNTARRQLLSAVFPLRFGRSRADETTATRLAGIGIGDELRRRLFDPMIVATLNTSPKHASAKLFDRVLKLAFLKGGKDAGLVIPTVGLSRLIEPAVRYIEERGGEVRTSSRVRQVRPDGDGTWVVDVDGREIRTRHLISALPWHAAARLLGPHVDHPAFAKQGVPQHNPIFSIYLRFDRPITGLPLFVALLGSRVEWVFDRRGIEGKREGDALLECVISDAGDLLGRSDDEVVADAERELRDRLPEIGDARLVASAVIREKRATFAATPEVEALRPEPGLLAPGLSICGDWTATGLPGTIEGAVRSGVVAGRAADEGAGRYRR